jgi:FkbM family methyltransferase
MRWCRQFHTAIDVGAHVGLWSMHLVTRFKMLHAFEPVARFRECWYRNIDPLEAPITYEMHECALGNVDGSVRMSIDLADTGGTHVSNALIGGESVPMFRLDTYEYSHVDFIKIDCEGYELHVLQGAECTLRSCRPCVIVEQKQHKMSANFGTKGTPAVDYLRDMGAILRREMGGDYILSWPD